MTPTDEAVAAYLDVLDRALEDRVVTGAEAEQLVSLAHEWGIDKAELDEIHVDYMRSLVRVALADHRLTQAEEADLRDVAELLGLGGRLAGLLAESENPAEGKDGVPLPRSELQGKTICFTGQLASTIGGEPITRERAKMLASAAGLEVRSSVTKSLELLVVADPDSMSAKAQKARQYGTRIIAERSFWQAIGAPVD